MKTITNLRKYSISRRKLSWITNQKSVLGPTTCKFMENTFTKKRQYREICEFFHPKKVSGLQYSISESDCYIMVCIYLHVYLV